MAAFFNKKRQFYISFPENVTEISDEPPFWESEREEAVEILTYIFETWNAAWNRTKLSLGDLNLSESNLRRLTFYENEQKKAVVSILAKILVAWEKDEHFTLSSLVVELAKELRPSLPYVEYDPKDNFTLTPGQISMLRNFMRSEAITLKELIADLNELSRKKMNFGEHVISERNAEALLNEKLGLTYFDFLDFSSEPEFSGSGYFPELLQESVDFGF